MSTLKTDAELLAYLDNIIAGTPDKPESSLGRQSPYKRNTQPDKPGTRYGRWTVVRQARALDGTKATWHIVQCDCGSPPRAVRQNALRQRHTLSCGCVRRNQA